MSDMRRLDDKTLQEIARLICGDDGPHYRQGRELARFLDDAGWKGPFDYDGERRLDWITQHLREHRDQPDDIEKVLIRLCDGREYLGEPAVTVTEVTQQLNQILVHEGYKVERPAGRPRLIECDPASASAATLAPVTLRTTMREVIQDPRLAAVLQSRLDEAQTSTENGCHVSAIIMLGSLLEGALLEAARTRLAPPPPPNHLKSLTLFKLLELARKHRWIGADALMYPCDALREYRNLVHPNAQLRMGDPPDRDTVDMCWPVVNATLNDLAASAPTGSPG
ncbi:hypothetical protein [Spirillospora sp. NBC_01491]|uniref:hypothetical protein n=1 Tax=Spirillospora sp. NBC_01491 TaxID=2976007 RepID=UPI002E32AC9F|nr:hypothetical protein [Spirillospora sp. NBC_01491]